MQAISLHLFLWSRSPSEESDLLHLSTESSTLTKTYCSRGVRERGRENEKASGDSVELMEAFVVCFESQKKNCEGFFPISIDGPHPL